MNIYRAIEKRMLTLDKGNGSGGGYFHTELQGICEVLALAWEEIPPEWQAKLYGAAMQAAEHFGLALDRHYSPRAWLVALMDLHEGKHPKTA